MSPKNLFETVPTIKVIGVGGAGCNAINRMVAEGLRGVTFVAMNTDRQALDNSRADVRIPLGADTTRGLGTGGDPERGRHAAKESERLIQDELDGADMVFIAAGMGGGTGTGAAPYLAEICRRMDILCVAVVTKPFGFEGARRKRLAENGIERLRASADTLIVIPNDKLLGVMERTASTGDAWRMADDVLRQGVQGISDIILETGEINVDFADVKAVLKDAGVAMMGVGHGVGDQRGRDAAESAAKSVMVETRIQGATQILVNVTSGGDFTLGDLNEAMEYVQQFADADEASIYMGHVVKPDMEGRVSITLLAAGMAQLRLPDASVFGEPAARRESRLREPEAVAEPARQPAVVWREEARVEARREEARPVETRKAEVRREEARPLDDPLRLEELDLDIPEFLRKIRERS